MTSKERVVASVRFKGPDRVPVDLRMMDAAYLRHGEKIVELLREHCVDFGLPKWDAGKMDPRSKPGTYEDEWGCIWENKAEGYFGMVVKHPLEDYRALDTFKPPFENMRDLASGGESEDWNREPDKFWLGFGADLFHRMCWLRGMDRVMMDLMDGAAGLYKLREMLLEFFSLQVSRQADTPVDAIVFADDLGSQRQLLMSPGLWRSFIKPLYTELFGICKRAGKLIFFHSDGYILEIMEDLIEMGVNALNCQVWCMGPELLGGKFRGRIAFWGEVNRQYTIPHGSPDDIRRSARTMKEHLATRAGGLIGEGEIDGLTPLENIRALLTAWNEP